MEVASTCTSTEPDCTTGYAAGDEATPSTTCPDGCILTEAAGGNAETCLARAYSCRDFDGGELPQFTTPGACTAGNDYETGDGTTPCIINLSRICFSLLPSAPNYRSTVATCVCPAR